MLPPAYSLAGDSYLRNPAMPDAAGQLRMRLQKYFQSWTGQAEIAAAAPSAAASWTAPARCAQLRALLAAQAAHGAFLFGRSSGAVAASLCAAEAPANGSITAPITAPITGLICLAYPFRAPGKADDPARYAHLARLSLPTLIIQGQDDPYGGPTALPHYRLPPSVQLLWVPGDHSLSVGPHRWDAIAAEVLEFCTRAAATAA